AHDQFDHLVLDTREVIDRAAYRFYHLLRLISQGFAASLLIASFALAFELLSRLGQDFVGLPMRLGNDLRGAEQLGVFLTAQDFGRGIRTAGPCALDQVWSGNEESHSASRISSMDSTSASAASGCRMGAGSRSRGNFSAQRSAISSEAPRTASRSRPQPSFCAAWTVAARVQSELAAMPSCRACAAED